MKLDSKQAPAAPSLVAETTLNAQEQVANGPETQAKHEPTSAKVLCQPAPQFINFLQGEGRASTVNGSRG
jgi:hypothetical protein